ncbi:integrase core domain-containing protein [Comamonas testosteroni]|uniref:integrase core domain-containing protein n=1 Tax=Comamonas testosteroni TaxID=285 RepID=UPI0009B7F43D
MLAALAERPFDSVQQARRWVLCFVDWHNEEHRHGALRYVTPGPRHRRRDPHNLAVLLCRRRALDS